MTSSNKSIRAIGAAALSIFLMMPVRALANTADNINRLLGAVRSSRAAPQAAQGPQEAPRLALAPDGYLTHIGAPPASYYPVSKMVPGNSRETARSFLNEYRGSFGAASTAVDFRSMKSRAKGGRRYERFQQTYQGIPVFSGEIIVQLNQAGGVEYVVSDIARETSALDSGKLPVIPSISSGEALRIARDHFSANRAGLKFDTTVPQLMIYQPSVIGDRGDTRLVWEFTITGKDPASGGQLLLDAHTGKIARIFPLIVEARDRQIFDAVNTTADPGTLERSEGDAASSVADVDDAYAGLGSVYDFFLTNHGRDSFDDAGATISSTVRYCTASDPCPYANAYFTWESHRIYVGQGLTPDDVLAHEFTHGVTHFESGLVYANESGAINESFSDTWGEFTDLTNTLGTDTTAVRWQIGEDLPGGIFRDMRNPQSRTHNWGSLAFSDPDRMSLILTNGDLTLEQWDTATGWSGNGDGICDAGETCVLLDEGGVHYNSGIGNKLVYLLTAGDTFNGYTITEMGIANVASLYYEVQTNILTSGEDYYDLHWALRQAAVNLGWSTAAKNNLYNACRAVEIVGASSHYFISTAGNDAANGSLGAPYRTVAKGNAVANPGDELIIAPGSYNETLVIDKIMTIRLWGSGEAVIGSP